MNPASAHLNRRELLLAGLGAATASRCSLPRNAEPALVAIVRCERYGQDVYAKVRHAVALCAPRIRGRNVVLKPNLVEFDSRNSINTHPILVHAALEAFRSLGAKSVLIAEGPGHRRNTLDLAEAAGYFDLVPGFEDLFVDLNVDEVSKVNLSRPVSRIKSLYLPHTALGADLLVSMPKMKTHHWVGATLSMKNLFGVVPGGVYGWPKNPLHWAGINESIVDLHNLFPRQFAIVDGIVGMEGNGPIQGKPKPMGVIVAGHHLPAVDATCCRLMEIDPAKLSYLTTAAGRAIETEAIRQIGEPIAPNRSRFELIEQFRNIRLSENAA
jgi:uncharacterized protein (DUF362 family)